MLAVDVEKRDQELFDKPFSDERASGERRSGGMALDLPLGSPRARKRRRHWGFFLKEIAEERAERRSYTWPGGLGAIYEKSWRRSCSQNTKDRMQTGATVVAVVNEKGTSAGYVHAEQRI